MNQETISKQAARIEELERNLAEQQATIEEISRIERANGVRLASWQAAVFTVRTILADCECKEAVRVVAHLQKHFANDGEELTTLLAKAKEQGRREAVPDFNIQADRFNDFCEQIFGRSMDLYDMRLIAFGRLVESECKAMLSATPKPE